MQHSKPPIVAVQIESSHRRWHLCADPHVTLCGLAIDGAPWDFDSDAWAHFWADELCPRCTHDWRRITPPRKQRASLKAEADRIRSEITAGEKIDIPETTVRSVEINGKVRHVARCEQCATEFIGHTKRARFCSQGCKADSQRGRTWQERTGESLKRGVVAKLADQQIVDDRRTRLGHWSRPNLDAPVRRDGVGGSYHDIVPDDASGGYW